jgi:protein TonB
VAGGFLASTLLRPVRFVSPRSVAVRLLPAGSLRGGAAARPAPPEPAKPKIVKAPQEDEPSPPSEKALRVPSKEPKKPVERPAPPARVSPGAPEVSLPSAGGEGSGEAPGPVGVGGSVGIGGATFDQMDFKYSYYVERMLIQIGLNWFKPAQSGSASPIIHFRIERDGTITDPVVQRSSGLPFVDRAALRAVLAASPLPPLPAEWQGDRLGVQLIFR